MKMGREHRVPLTEQMLKLLSKLRTVTGGNDYLFPQMRDPSKPMNSQTLNQILKRNGYKNKLVSHGFRAMASTYLYDKGYDGELVESCLAHVFGNQTVQAYNRGDFFKSRIKLMTDWSNYLAERYEKHPAITLVIYPAN